MVDLLNGKISDTNQYSETVLNSMATCLGIEGGIWTLKQLSHLKSSTASIKYPETRPSPYEKGEIAKGWSREVAIARGDQIVGEEVDLIFTINGKPVTTRADVLTTSDGQLYALVESKYSFRASYTPNQKTVLPELIRSGDTGLIAEVGARSGTLLRGTRIRVVFQGDVWESAPTLLGQ